MHLVQVFFPLTTAPERENALREVRQMLIDRFGGVTAFTRAPADGAWRDSNDRVEHDQIVILETMVETLDPAWWRQIRTDLETRLGEEEILIRSHPIQKL